VGIKGGLVSKHAARLSFVRYAKTKPKQTRLKNENRHKNNVDDSAGFV
jgi:hypothetical protein